MESAFLGMQRLDPLHLRQAATPGDFSGDAPGVCFGHGYHGGRDEYTIRPQLVSVFGGHHPHQHLQPPRLGAGTEYACRIRSSRMDGRRDQPWGFLSGRRRQDSMDLLRQSGEEIDLADPSPSHSGRNHLVFRNGFFRGPRQFGVLGGNRAGVRLETPPALGNHHPHVTCKLSPLANFPGSCLPGSRGWYQLPGCSGNPTCRLDRFCHQSRRILSIGYGTVGAIH